MDTVLQGIVGTICYIDDILVTGSSEEYSIRVKRAECSFMSENVEYSEHHIDSDGLLTLASKVEAIILHPSPGTHRNSGVTSLLQQFFSGLATLLHPLLQAGPG